MGFGKVKSVKSRFGEIELVNVETRVWKTARPEKIDVRFVNGQRLTLLIDKGFHTDGRSGPKIVDYIIPQFGGQGPSICWLVHDILYHDFDISRESADKILRDMLKYYGYMWRASLVYNAVDFAGEDKFGFDPTKQTLPISFRENKELVDVLWR